jgi:hypothetical protein
MIVAVAAEAAMAMALVPGATAAAKGMTMEEDGGKEGGGVAQSVWCRRTWAKKSVNITFVLIFSNFTVSQN